MPVKLRLYFSYYKAIQSFNVPFSLFAGLLGLSLESDKWSGFLGFFFISFLSGGFLLALYFYEYRYYDYYYFYANRGLSRRRLIGSVFLINLCFLWIFQITKFIFHA